MLLPTEVVDDESITRSYIAVNWSGQVISWLPSLVRVSSVKDNNVVIVLVVVLVLVVVVLVVGFPVCRGWSSRGWFC